MYTLLRMLPIWAFFFITTTTTIIISIIFD